MIDLATAYPTFEEGVKDTVIFYYMRITFLVIAALNFMYSLFYNAEKKREINPDIFFFINGIVLAFCIIGDAGWNGSNVRLYSNGFSVKDCVILMNVLKIKFHIDCTLNFDNDQPMIYVGAVSLATVRALVFPYMHSSM